MSTHVIEVGKDPTQNRVVVKSATESRIDRALAAAAAALLPAVLNAHEKRQSVAKELDEQAAKWERRRDAQTAPTSELRRYYAEKAAEARRLAKSIREGKDSDNHNSTGR